MKRFVLILTVTVLMVSVVLLTGCAASKEKRDEQTDKSANTGYEFELPDVNGNVHKLSEYRGKPVFLEVWASWCSVCLSGLPDIDAMAAGEQDFYILSVLTPSYAGEKAKDDLIAWYKAQGYENLIVLIDEDRQFINDFGVKAFPTNVFFDAQGSFAGGRVGMLSKEQISEEMAKLSIE